MRIIGGRFKGRRLASFKGVSIRPTSDKVREAVFNILPMDFPFGRVLDLFAGTGAMGLEAMSRGAESASFVDGDPASVAVIRKNLSACGVSARVIMKNAAPAIRELGRRGESFDLIIIDPPYASGLLDEALGLIEKNGLLAEDGFIVAEGSRRAPLKEVPAGLELVDERRYGDTLVYFLRRGSTDA